MPTINFSPADILLALYPEIHYRFPCFKFSRYFKREPEIITDIPRRVENNTVPVLLLVKDAHLFPLEFERDLTVKFASRTREFARNFELPNNKIESPWWWIIFELDNIHEDHYRIDCELSYKCGAKRRTALNHNLKGLPRTAFHCYSSPYPLPRPEDYILGDMHTHSGATADHIEFGAPLKPLAKAGKACGMDFLGVTDHTYDLDDDPEDYLRKDPALSKWRNFLQEAGEINADISDQYAHILPGQEITVRNRRGKNVHLLLFGGDKLYSGSGDSAEKWFNTRSEYSIQDIVALKGMKIIAGAAHPADKPGILQKLLLNRGYWRAEDFIEGLDGAQFANGWGLEPLLRALKSWEKLLTSGKRIPLWAGTDAHGNFNRYRQVGLPMWNLVERNRHYLGMQKTGVYSPGGRENLWEGLKSGSTYITDGPGLNLVVNDARPGGKVEAGANRIELEAVSSKEFGKIDDIAIRFFDKEGNLSPKRFANIEAFDYKVDLKLDLKPGFIYAQALTVDKAVCVTSPVYIE